MKLIFLSEKDAQQVTKCSTADGWLEPRAVEGGFILNPLVLADPVHQVHWEFLQSLPQVDIESINWLPNDDT